MSLRTKAAALTVTAVLGGGLAVPAGSAMAASAEQATSTGVRGTAPACVTRDVIKQKKQVTVKNNCGKTMHLKVVINSGPDLRCWTYSRGKALVWKWRIGSYGKVVTC